MEISQKIFVLEKFWSTFEKNFKKFQKPFIQYLNNSNCKAYLKQLRKTSRKKTGKYKERSELFWGNFGKQ